MISVNKVSIRSLDDYDDLLDNIADPIYIRKEENGEWSLLKELKRRVGLKCKTIVVEDNYIDYDFTSTYSSFYTRKHKRIPKECVRLHFFADHDCNDYKGFLSVRPSHVDNRGKAYISPDLLLDRRAYLMTAGFSSNILGVPFGVNAYPWMAQETDISVCAHVSSWSILRYFSHKWPSYKDTTINDVVDNTPQFLGRKMPSDGLNLIQISEILSSSDMHPLIIKQEEAREFERSVFSYVESGIPVVGVMADKEHAITIIGHGPLSSSSDIEHLFEEDRFVYSNELIEDLIVSDDNCLPYTELSKVGDGKRYLLSDLDFAIVPLYEKMFLTSEIVFERIESLFKSGSLSLPERPVFRTYIASSKSFKAKIVNDDSVCADLKKIISKLCLPKFIWCSDVSSFKDYSRGLVSTRVIIDTTAGKKEHHPWLFMHDSSTVKYFDNKDSSWIEESLDIEAYNSYRKNLREVGAC